ncbi:calcineurin-like phosphoesterase [Tribonema minus]|uniref:Calcineurin-like phosphoesterase n=1 Tax=Tribonema minus TaxID=303371 RepID=A0A836CA66_9STRA|nr:calcineurin-like phosphoesterase [Tribonema minus]
MDDHLEARDHVTSHLSAEAFLLETRNAHLVSLGDLGGYKAQPGTRACFARAKEYLDGFEVDYGVVAGNHDLEGLGEFPSDAENLAAFQDAFGMAAPCWARRVARRTLLVGLSTTRFRDAAHSSHEVHIPRDQLDWLDRVCAAHAADDGWRVLVFTHAPPMGSGLRVVQDVHIKNGCAWLNHSAPDAERRAFAEACRKYPQISAWFSGHFHLSHDFEDSISQVRRGGGGTEATGRSCVFVQCGVIGSDSCRDGRRQTRIVAGTRDALSIYTVSHHQGGQELRLDASVTFQGGAPARRLVSAHGHEDYDHASWFSAYTPQPLDGCYLESRHGLVAAGPHAHDAVCWWHMADGRVLGVHDGMVVEYDAETLAPLGIVCDRKQVKGREVVVVEGGHALLLVPWRVGEEDEAPEVVHPNQDGSYWRRRQRNKAVRQAEAEREALAAQWLQRRRDAEQPSPAAAAESA